MPSINDFQFYDPDAEMTMTMGDLPHWQQAGATYFITYRTFDSISKTAVAQILAERDDWLQRHGINATDADWHNHLRKLPLAQQQAFRRTLSNRFEQELDQLAGECLLKKPNLASIVSDSLHHFDNERYLLGAFVVMPNHVHVLVRVFPEYEMLKQCFSWKHFQAHEINLSERRSGHIFQSESFDHLVRDSDHFFKFRRYIEDNPRKAKLKSSEFLLYLPEIT